jgi:hypothetical protein
MQAHPTAVQLDREQCAALRREIWIMASGIPDIALPLDQDHDLRPGDRAFVLRWIAHLHRIVEMLDAIGWREPADGPPRVDVEIGAELAEWARTQSSELQRSFDDGEDLVDEDLDALSAFSVIGEAI